MTNTRALALIDALSRDEAALRGQEFLAPLLGSRARLRVHGLVYELAVANATPGWWVYRSLDARRAEIAGMAQPWQRGDYLALWPALRLVLIEPLRSGDWAALPFNPSDAVQRFGLRGPLVVRLVEHGQRFERVIGRVEGKTVWYDEHDRRADLLTAETLRAALAAGDPTPRVVGLGAGERAAYALLAARRLAAEAGALAARTEYQLRAALEIGGAQLIGYETTDDQLRVTWERDGQRSVTLVSTSLAVVSAGVCLSGQDSRFDLTSIVGVVGDAPGFARWDAGDD